MKITILYIYRFGSHGDDQNLIAFYVGDKQLFWEHEHKIDVAIELANVIHDNLPINEIACCNFDVVREGVAEPHPWFLDKDPPESLRDIPMEVWNDSHNLLS